MFCYNLNSCAPPSKLRFGKRRAKHAISGLFLRFQCFTFHVILLDGFFKNTKGFS